MNVLHKFTRESLKRNRSRTLVTIIGIVLSVALVTAVIEAANSGLSFLVRDETARAGAFHGAYFYLDAQDVEKIEQTDGIKDTAEWQEVGWSRLETGDADRPYLLIRAVSENFEDLVAVRLTEGAMPESESEIVLPVKLKSRLGCAVGDKLTLPVGQRLRDGEKLRADEPYCDGETISGESERSYTIVGFCKQLDNAVEDAYGPGYTALTAGGGTGAYAVFFTVDDPSNYYAFVKSNGLDYTRANHNDILLFSGSMANGNLTAVLYGLVAILVALISLGSISLIYNAFSISVSERTKQIGIFKSVGATGRQIRGTVLYEALLLCAVGIPIGLLVGCGGIGLTLWLLRNAFSALVGMSSGVQMYLVISPLGLAASAAVCLLTVLISAYIPAARAMRMPALEAIRQTEDVKLRARDVRCGALTGKLFGFEATLSAKNFGRNRKRYRATVISLVLSITLFISASSFCSYLTGSVADSGALKPSFDISYYTVGSEGDKPDADAMLELLSGVAGVEEASYADSVSELMRFDSACVDASYAKSTGLSGSTDSEQSVGMSIAFIDDAAFRRLCSENGIDPAAYFDTDAPLALLYNDGIARREGDGDATWAKYKALDPAALPCSGYTSINKQIDGYGEYSTEDGGSTVVYYPEDHLYEYYDGDRDSLDESLALKLPAAEVEERTVYSIGGVVSDAPLALPANVPALIYPFSMERAIKSGSYIYATDFVFKAADHAQAAEDMERLLSERGFDTSRLSDIAQTYESDRMLLVAVNVFAYGFIVLISLIAVANVFNTVSTSIALRRREFAMLKSVGLTGRGFAKMMNYECLIYGSRALLWGIPAALLVTYLIWNVTSQAVSQSFYVPWSSVVIAVGSVFAVVFATMLYAAGKIRRDNPIDALKNENL